MTSIQLFPKDQITGVFKGFREGGLEFHADLVLPYRNEFQNIPMHGQFLLVQLETPDEAVLGRIASFSSEGKLSSGAGEEFNIRAMREERPVPDDLREQYLKYRVNIRVLGILRGSGPLTFVPSHRRLPHVGSPVAFASGQVLQELARHNLEGAAIGHFALGEYVFADGDPSLDRKDWMQVKAPNVLVRFPVSDLVSRRSFIFARAGFGKSNLNKLLFSELYKTTPFVTKAAGRRAPVGTIIFDPDGEYFWPDDKGRPGLCDVPHLVDKVVVFTSRHSPSPFYQSFVAGGIKLDVRRLRPSDVIGIALSPEKQEQQNVRKLKGLDPTRWERLVNLINGQGNQTDLDEICDILELQPNQQEAEALAARANVTSIVRTLHDPGSHLMDMLVTALAEGKLCVVDISQLRGGQALILSGLILRRIFDRNQQEFTSADPKTIPTIAVVEEAQSVLNEKATSAEPYIAWVKEGRKYDLGAMLVTQQPGSIPVEILSQGDNWFIFHLLSTADLQSVAKANAHFSADLLSSLLNEPIPGQGVFWSTGGGRSFPISIRVLSFEKLYLPQDIEYNRAAVPTFATALQQRFPVCAAPPMLPLIPEEPLPELSPDSAPTFSDPQNGQGVVETTPRDVLADIEQKARNAVAGNADLQRKLKGAGVPWWDLQRYITDQIPADMDGRRDLAYRMVPKVLDNLFGAQSKKGGWHSFKQDHFGKQKTHVKAGPKAP